MMRKRRAFVPTTLNRLEDRVTLSHAMATPAIISPAATNPPATHAINLVGTVKGFETPSPLASAIPGGLLLRGQGKVAPLGQVGLIGRFSIRSGEPTFYDGTEVLFNGRGGIVVHIAGIVGGPSGPPAHLHYQILAGWGAFQGATGKGNVVYTQGPAAAVGTSFSLIFGTPIPTPMA